MRQPPRATLLSSTNFLRYDTQAASWPWFQDCQFFPLRLEEQSWWRELLLLSGTFTPLDITAATSTLEIFDLGNLVTNPKWIAAGYPNPPINTSGPLINQLTIGGFQLTWLNVHNPAEQQNGCMGGGYDAINQLFYTNCPQASPLASAFQIGPL